MILRPYRTDRLRQYDAQIREHDYTQIPIFLRTHYSLEEDQRARHDELMVQRASAGKFEYGAWAWGETRDDVTEFAFGSDWRHIFDILPEIAGPTRRGGLDERVRKRAMDSEDEMRSRFRTRFKETLHREKHSNTVRWFEN